MSTNVPADDREWKITERWLQYGGELRANMIRIVGVGVFYLLHLWNYLGSNDKLGGLSFINTEGTKPVDRTFHVQATLLALAWVSLAAGVHVALANRFFPRWISTFVTCCDTLLLTALLCLAGGPKSPLVVGYFLIVAMAGLRQSLRLVWLATIATMLGYLAVLGCARWPTTFGIVIEMTGSVPRFEQLVTLAALAVLGITVGQIVRQTRVVCSEYANRSDPSGDQ